MKSQSSAPPISAASAALRLLPTAQAGLRARAPQLAPETPMQIALWQRMSMRSAVRGRSLTLASEFVSDLGRAFAFPVTLSWSWKALVFALVSRNHLDDVHGRRQRDGFRGPGASRCRSRTGKQRGFENHRRIHLFRVDGVPQRKLDFAFGAGHRQL